MTAIAWYILASVREMRCNMIRIFLLLCPLLLRRCCTAIACSRGRVIVHCVLTFVGWGSLDGRQILVLAVGLVVSIAACAAVAAAVATVVAVAITSRVRLAGPSVGAGVGVRCHACYCIDVLSLDVGVG